MKPLHIYCISLGCSKNKVDTEQVLGSLMDSFSYVSCVGTIKDADIIFLNTCSFLSSARNEVYDTLQTLQNKLVILAGCFAPYATMDIFKKYPQVRAVVRQGYYDRMAEIVKLVLRGERIFLNESPVSSFDTNLHSRVITTIPYAYVKIAEGCNNACSYCLIPTIRGKYRSKPIEVIKKEVHMLVASGVREIILLAQDTSCYGVDLYHKKALHLLLQQLERIKNIHWIRLHYTYPDRITEELIEVMARSKKIVPYLDIPFQHGDPTILKQMHRPTHVDKWKRLIQNIRNKIPNICFRSTFIVGFPGEKKVHFDNLQKFIQEIRFDRVGFFAYSREKGTKSYDMKSQVSQRMKQQRLETISLLQQSISSAIQKEKIGSIMEVLIESYDSRRKVYIGRSYRDSPDIDGKVFVTGKDLVIGSFYPVRIVKAYQYDLKAVVI